jgi:hypothetical protein
MKVKGEAKAKYIRLAHVKTKILRKFSTETQQTLSITRLGA